MEQLNTSSKASNVKIQSFLKDPLDTEAEIDHHMLTQIIRIRSQEKQMKLRNIFSFDNKELSSFFTSYQFYDGLQMNLSSQIEKGLVKLIKNNNRIYFGEVDNQIIKQGKGIAVYSDGKIYEGQFLGNQRNGLGLQIYPNFNVYIGEYEKNKKHGKGTFYWFNISNSNGHSKNKTEYYKGQWWGGLPCGLGCHQRANGDYYQGEFKNGLKHGQGYQTFYNGDSYMGSYTNGLPQGYGEYTWSDGSHYKGDFKQGVRNGFGIWKKNKNKYCESYRGHYILDQKSGYGVYIWDNGDYYKGTFFDDRRHGYGELYNKNDVIYQGMWEMGEEMPEQSFPKKKQFYKQQLRKNLNSITIRELSEGDIIPESQAKQKQSIGTNKNNSPRRREEEESPKNSKRKLNTREIERLNSERKQKIGHRNCIPIPQYERSRLRTNVKDY